MTNEEAISLISKNKSVFKYDTEMTKALNLAINALKKSPQGEWIKNTDTVFKNRFNCSICGKLIFEPKEENNYCSNCGAKMKGGAE